MKLIIGNVNYSSWSLRPWLLLAMHDIPFEEVRIPLYQEGSASRLAACSPSRKVPVLHDGEVVVWDSLAICEYVSERYLDGGGWPGDPRDRAEARSCSAEMHSGFIHIRERLPMNCRARGRKAVMTAQLDVEIERVVTLWSGLREKHASTGPWLFGDFSIADCMFAPMVSRFGTYDVALAEICAGYMAHVLASDKMKLWYEKAGTEDEIIEASETGM